MTIHDQVPPIASLDEMGPAQARYDAAYKGDLSAYAIKICRTAVSPAVMLRAALIIAWVFLLAVTSVGAIWVYALRQIGAYP